MDHAVALVRTYLQLNGYLTVTEYPVLEAARHGGHRTLTDLDVLAFRFPGAGRLTTGTVGHAGARDGTAPRFEPDPVLGVAGTEADMIVGEVKEGRARLNEGLLRPDVLEVVLARFGCCAPEQAYALAQALIERGTTTMPAGHRVRLVVFASVVEPVAQPGLLVVPLGHVVAFLDRTVSDYWDVLHHAQLKDPVLGFLMTLRKARRRASNPTELPR
jgi:hypothetical protein